MSIWTEGESTFLKEHPGLINGGKINELLNEYACSMDPYRWNGGSWLKMAIVTYHHFYGPLHSKIEAFIAEARNAIREVVLTISGKDGKEFIYEFTCDIPARHFDTSKVKALLTLEVYNYLTDKNSSNKFNGKMGSVLPGDLNCIKNLLKSILANPDSKIELFYS